MKQTTEVSDVEKEIGYLKWMLRGENGLHKSFFETMNQCRLDDCVMFILDLAVKRYSNGILKHTGEDNIYKIESKKYKMYLFLIRDFFCSFLNSEEIQTLYSKEFNPKVLVESMQDRIKSKYINFIKPDLNFSIKNQEVYNHSKKILEEFKGIEDIFIFRRYEREE